MYALPEAPQVLIDRFVHVDHDRTMALVAVTGEGAGERIFGVARYALTDEGARECEFAVTVADTWQGRGVGTTLARALFNHARSRGFRRIYGTILTSNTRMQVPAVGTPQIVLRIGYPAQDLAPVPRRPLDEVIQADWPIP